MFKIISVTFMLVTFVSCGHRHGHGGTESTLNLNQGKKWKSDKHTMKSIKKMRKISLKSKKISNSLLKERLDKEVGILVKGCTMKGAHHDALHVFLEKLLPEIGNLDAGDKNSSMDSKKEIIDLLAQYTKYFEL